MTARRTADGQPIEVNVTMTRTVVQLGTVLVSESRRHNGFCKRNSRAIESQREHERFADFARNPDRYQWFNVRSYVKHSTFEIRLHSGTINTTKVCNWIVAHLRFVEAIVRLSREEVTHLFAVRTPQSLYAACREFWPQEIADYLHDRAAQFGTVLPSRELMAVNG